MMMMIIEITETLHEDLHASYKKHVTIVALLEYSVCAERL
jgi:hypothetical protein